MDKPIKIKAEYLTKKFSLLPSKDSKNKAKTLFGLNKKHERDFWALRNVSFEIHEGECVGVIGLNGAGKSTLSNIISSQIAQTTGTVEVHGDVSIIAANAGMKNALSGRENIRLKALMMGMSNKEINAKMDDIIEFSELGPFIDQPVKTYSSGMKAKLGFSIMVHQDPDIMIIDEGLSVGDRTFVDKSKRKMFEFRDQGKTILMVSHDMRVINDWCDRVIWLNYGEVKAYGTPEEVVPQYNKFAQWFKKLNRKQQNDYKKKQREAQLNYSVDNLRKNIVEDDPLISRRAEREITKEIKDDHKLSIPSKLLVAFCSVAFVWIALVSMSSASFVQSVLHPKQFLTSQLFDSAHPVAASKRGVKPEKSIVRKPVTKPKKKNSSSSKSPSSSKSASSSSSSSATSSSVAASSSSTPTSTAIQAGTYQVQSGDSLALIAERAGITLAALKAANSGSDLSVIHAGESLTIPSANSTGSQNTYTGSTNYTGTSTTANPSTQTNSTANYGTSTTGANTASSSSAVVAASSSSQTYITNTTESEPVNNVVDESTSGQQDWVSNQ